MTKALLIIFFSNLLKLSHWVIWSWSNKKSSKKPYNANFQIIIVFNLLKLSYHGDFELLFVLAFRPLQFSWWATNIFSSLRLHINVWPGVKLRSINKSQKICVEWQSKNNLKMCTNCKAQIQHYNFKKKRKEN